MDSQNESMFLRISYTNPATLIKIQTSTAMAKLLYDKESNRANMKFVLHDQMLVTTEVFCYETFDENHFFRTIVKCINFML